MVNDVVLAAQVVNSDAQAGLRDWLAVPRNLLKFLGVLVTLCAIACLYFWQVSNISMIREGTQELQAQARQMERENAALMLQVAAWDRPDHVMTEAIARGMTPTRQLTYIDMPGATTQRQTPAGTSALATWWQRLLSDLQVRSPGNESIPGVAQASK